MPSNNLVPVQLQNNTNKSDEIAYINQNFRTISDAFNPIIMSDGANNRVVIGKFEPGQYGIVGADTDGNRRILIGQSPDDGRTGIWVSKEGIDVIDELNGV